MKALFYWASQVFMRAFARVVWGLRIEGRERVPETGAVVFAATHESFMDPVFLGAVCPRVRYLARSSLFVRADGTRRRLASWLGSLYGVVEIDRDAGGSEGLRRSVEELRAGHSLLMFPEGTRSPDGSIRPLQPGVGLIALRAGVPVVPVSISGSRLVWGRGARRPKLFTGPVRVAFGDPTTYQKPTKAAEVAADLRDRLHRLRGESGPTIPRDGGDEDADTGGSPST